MLACPCLEAQQLFGMPTVQVPGPLHQKHATAILLNQFSSTLQVLSSGFRCRPAVQRIRERRRARRTGEGRPPAGPSGGRRRRRGSGREGVVAGAGLGPGSEVDFAALVGRTSGAGGEREPANATSSSSSSSAAAARCCGGSFPDRKSVV